MGFHPFSLKNDKERFPGFEVVVIFLFLIFIYTGGVSLLPKLTDNIEHVVREESKERLIAMIQYSFLAEEGKEGENRVYTVVDLIEMGLFVENENQEFLERYTTSSFIVITYENGGYEYEITLIDK